jgi:pimeloyl-ACP methyl ester carboxylesterase
VSPGNQEAEQPGVVHRRIRGSGLDLAVTEGGDPSGPTVLMVHGFPESSAVWVPLSHILSKEFHAVAYDVRGSGASDVPDTGAEYALPLLVADMAAVIDAMSPGAPVHLVAHDWGSIQGWEAVTSDALAGRIASFTSISGPPLDHVALWARRHRTWKPADLRILLGQAAHSWYIALFHLPYLPNAVIRGVTAQRHLAAFWHRRIGTPAGPQPPVSTKVDDFAHGLELYRANVRRRLRHPVLGHTEAPVQIIVPKLDRYVTPSLLDGLERWSPVVWRREVDAGHWIIRSHPNEVADWVRQVVAFVETGDEVEDLARWRVAPNASTIE